MNYSKTLLCWTVGLLVAVLIAGCHSLAADTSSTLVGIVASEDGKAVSDARGKGYDYQPSQAKRVPGPSS